MCAWLQGVGGNKIRKKCLHEGFIHITQYERLEDWEGGGVEQRENHIQRHINLSLPVVKTDSNSPGKK